MAKKSFGRLLALAAVIGTTAAAVSYYLKYRSFSKELDEDFHDFESDFEDEDEFDAEETAEIPQRNYVTLSQKTAVAKEVLKDAADKAAHSARNAADIVKETVKTMADKAKAAGKEAAEKTEDAVEEIEDIAEETAGEVCEACSETVEEAVDKTEEVVKEAVDVVEEIAEEAEAELKTDIEIETSIHTEA